MKIVHVCPKAGMQVDGEVIGNGLMQKEAFHLVDGLPGKHILQWKTIIVKCSYCGECHEYALVLDPLANQNQ